MSPDPGCRYQADRLTGMKHPSCWLESTRAIGPYWLTADIKKHPLSIIGVLVAWRPLLDAVDAIRASADLYSKDSTALLI